MYLFKREGQVALSKELQVVTAVADSTGFRPFVVFAVMDKPEALSSIVDTLNAKYGLSITEAVASPGQRVLAMERGFTPADDRLPEFFRLEKLPSHESVFDIPDQMPDQIFDAG